ncbi:MAG: hypothetical protein FJ318_07025 [SAR202 cluster bacterium]|nr:hypothetical protein [SAR202 cluster bacterium]
MRPGDEAALFQPLLRRGERVLWTGRPRPGVRLAPIDRILVPFSGAWALVLALAYVSAARQGTLSMTWFVPLAAVAAYLVMGRFMLGAYLRGRARYAITNRRVIAVGGLFGHTATSRDIDSIDAVAIEPHPDGAATLWLRSPVLQDRWAAAAFPGLATGRGALVAVDGARAAFDLLSERLRQRR